VGVLPAHDVVEPGVRARSCVGGLVFQSHRGMVAGWGRRALAQPRALRPSGWRSPGARRRCWPLRPARAAHLAALAGGWPRPIGAVAQQLWAGGVLSVCRLSIPRALLRATAATSGPGGTDDCGRGQHVRSARR
jgi:hypothetical protein